MAVSLFCHLYTSVRLFLFGERITKLCLSVPSIVLLRPSSVELPAVILRMCFRGYFVCPVYYNTCVIC